MEDARTNTDTIGIGQAASLLGATRRAVQTWVDEGVIAAAGSPDRIRGTRRRILRAEFMRALPRLRKRLETPAVLGFKKKRVDQQEAAPAAPSPPDPVPQPSTKRDTSTPSVTALKGPVHTEPPVQSKASPAQRVEATTSHAPVAAEVPPGREPDESRRAKERAANAIEAMLRQARDAKQRESELEEQAARIATKLLDAVFSNELTRVDALLMFANMTSEQNIPVEVRTRVRKQFFGR